MLTEAPSAPTQPWQEEYALSRLARFVWKSREYAKRPGPDPWLLRLLRWAIYSALRDCRDLGLAKEAVDLLKENGSTIPLEQRR